MEIFVYYIITTKCNQDVIDVIIDKCKYSIGNIGWHDYSQTLLIYTNKVCRHIRYGMSILDILVRFFYYGRKKRLRIGQITW
jgi:hypothetical protein